MILPYEGRYITGRLLLSARAGGFAISYASLLAARHHYAASPPGRCRQLI